MPTKQINMCKNRPECNTGEALSSSVLPALVRKTRWVFRYICRFLRSWVKVTNYYSLPGLAGLNRTSSGDSIEKPPWWVEGIRKQISIKKCYGISGGKRKEIKRKEKAPASPLWHNRFPDEGQNDYIPNRTPEEWHTEKNELPPYYVNELWSL